MILATKIWKSKNMLIAADIETNWPIAIPRQVSTEGTNKTSYHKTSFNSITTYYGCAGQVLCDVNFKLTTLDIEAVTNSSFHKTPKRSWVRSLVGL